MERVVPIQSSNAGLFRQRIGTVVTGYIAVALLVITAVLPATARAAIFLSGSPPTSIVATQGVYHFKPTVSASSGSTVKFSISSKPYWATFIPSTGELYGGTYPSNVGSYANIKITASDGKSTASIGPFAISVLATGTSTAPPVVTPPVVVGPPVTSPPTTTPTAATLQLSAPSYSVAQTAGQVTVQVNRVAGSTGAVSAKYATANNSAVAGTDYTAVSGTVSWASGETATKNINVPVMNTTPFTGTKSFMVALSNPSTGATVGTPASAAVAIAGSAAPTPPATGKGAPAAVTNLLLAQQGGTNNANAPLTNSQQLTWSAAAAGASPIDHYKIYRNGAAYATTTALTYTDTAATNSNDPKWGTATTVYSYNVSAVDTSGNEGPQASTVGVYAYRNGKSTWGNNDLSYGSLNENYSSSAGSPQSGSFDVAVNFINGGFQPAVAPPQAPMWDLEIGAFNYAVVDINPGSSVNNGRVPFGTVSRLPPGDVYGWHPTVNLYDYGPAPVANKWATYKIPLATLGMGFCKFTGSISGNKLTVTAITSGASLVDAGGFVTGPGVPAGTYISGYDQHSAIGTFTLGGPGINANTKVASSSLTFQRTSLYKFGMQPDVQGMTMYFNNMGFTSN
ncbi:MAG TPA: Calx-beta domain-containing protein [Steroidobacteraceae bacterium]|nr:Calx-beta domain-containing protein [Steroidobacteraceae bacterium]